MTGRVTYKIRSMREAKRILGEFDSFRENPDLARPTIIRVTGIKRYSNRLPRSELMTEMGKIAARAYTMVNSDNRGY